MKRYLTLLLVFSVFGCVSIGPDDLVNNSARELVFNSSISNNTSIENTTIENESLGIIDYGLTNVSNNTTVEVDSFLNFSSLKKGILGSAREYYPEFSDFEHETVYDCFSLGLACFEELAGLTNVEVSYGKELSRSGSVLLVRLSKVGKKISFEEIAWRSGLDDLVDNSSAKRSLLNIRGNQVLGTSMSQENNTSTTHMDYYTLLCGDNLIVEILSITHGKEVDVGLHENTLAILEQTVGLCENFKDLGINESDNVSDQEPKAGDIESLKSFVRNTVNEEYSRNISEYKKYSELNWRGSGVKCNHYVFRLDQDVLPQYACGPEDPFCECYVGEEPFFYLQVGIHEPIGEIDMSAQLSEESFLHQFEPAERNWTVYYTNRTLSRSSFREELSTADSPLRFTELNGFEAIACSGGVNPGLTDQRHRSQFVCGDKFIIDLIGLDYRVSTVRDSRKIEMLDKRQRLLRKIVEYCETIN